MNNLKKYITPSAETIKVSMVDNMCNTSISDTAADPNKDVMSKKGDLLFDDEEEEFGNW